MKRERLLPFLLRRKMNTVTYCYISEIYYQDYSNLIKILDINDSSKHNIRTHICLKIKYNNHNILIPLRKQLPDSVRKYGRIGHSVPSQSKPNAGLDYRYIMIIKDDKYIRYDKPRIPNSQQNIIANEYTKIEQEALEYIKAYIRVAKKNRVQRTARFRESSLINFHKELGITNNVDTPQEQEA